jgi:signal transduction histidine kinase
MTAHKLHALDGKTGYYRIFLMTAGIAALFIITAIIPFNRINLPAAAILWVLISFQSLFPLKLFSRELNIVHITALGAGLLYGPTPVGWAVLFGTLTAYGIRRYTRARLRGSRFPFIQNIRETLLPAGAILVALCTPLLIFIFATGSASPISYPQGFAVEILTAIAFTALYSLLIMVDLLLSDSRPDPDTRRDFTWFACLQIFPLPFILIILLVNPAGRVGSLILMGGITSILAVLFFRYSKIRADLQLRTRQLDDLNQFSTRITTTLDKGDLLNELCKAAVNLSGGRSSAVFLHNLGEGRVQLETAYQLGDDFLSGSRSFLFSPNGRAQCLSTGQPVLIPDVTQGKLETDFFNALQREGIWAVGDFPLLSPDGSIGYLSVYFERVHRFNSEETKLLETISAQAAISVSNARLHERTDLALSRRIHQLSILETMGRELAEAVESDRLFEMIIDYAVEFTDANWGSIGLLDLMAQRVTVKAWRGYSGFPTVYFVKDGLPGRAIHLQQAVNSKDVLVEDSFIDFTEGRVRSHLSVPMLHASKVLGVISLESARPAAFTDVDQIFIGQLATQAAVATELYQSVQTRELITETLVHDIRSPVSAVLGALEVIEESSVELRVERAAGIDEAGITQVAINQSAINQGVITQAIQVARQGAFRVLNLIESLLDIARFQSGKIEIIPEWIELRSLVSDIFHSFELQSKEYGVALCNNVPADLPDLYIDQGKISRVLSNLVDNALKFSPSGSQVNIDGSVAGKGEVLIKVVDNGPGITEEYREKIFERFGQIPGVQARRRGTGLGLTFCRLAIEAHGGHIWVESNPAGGSIFNLTLPSNAP